MFVPTIKVGGNKNMTIKLFKEFEGWDVLKEFYKEDINIVSGCFEDKFERTFCKNCGTFAEDIEFCKCGNNHYKRISENVSDFYFTHTKSSNDFTLNITQLIITIEDRTKLSASIKTTKILEIIKDKLNYYNPDFLSYLNENNLKDYDNYKNLEIYDKILYSHYAKYLCNIGEDFIKKMFLITYHQDLIDDYRFWQYPNITSFLLEKNDLYKNKEKISYKNLLLKYNLLEYEEYFELLDNSKISLKQDENNSISQIKTLESLTGLEQECWFFLKHQVENKILSLENAYSIILDYHEAVLGVPTPNRYSFYNSKETKIKEIHLVYENYFKYFIYFLRYYINDVSYYSCFNTFLKKIDFLKEKGIDVNENTLKPKYINALKHTDYLKFNLKYPEEKIDMFSKYFSDNPLETLSLLKDRRKLTKKQLEILK